MADIENESEADLTMRTQQFKEKMDSLDRMHNEILDELAAKRDEAIDGIQKQIEELEADKPNRLKEYEDQLESISDAYEAMIKDEKAKQIAFAEQIKKAKREQDLFVENMRNEELESIDDFRNEKDRLEEIHRQNLDESFSEFNNISENIRQEFEKLVSEKKALDADIADLVNKYKQVDDEVAQEELELKYEANARLLDVSTIFEEEQTIKKEKLSILDILNDADVDIFK